ncbi:hypothetical protein GCM10022267_90170 [Lentzea roselyniae]|uniref:DUF3291 domain-containing protein n=1 Tax=Lentzea roselyniae TaxID=531940 RepID=A0ABP7CF74_9PSEU
MGLRRMDAASIDPRDNLVTNITVWESRRRCGNLPTVRSIESSCSGAANGSFFRLRHPQCCGGSSRPYPTVFEADERLNLLREMGPTPQAFTFAHSYEPTGELVAA